VEISHELDQPGLKGLVAFLGPVLLDALFEKIMPGVFHPNLLIYCRKEGVTFTEARRYAPHSRSFLSLDETSPLIGPPTVARHTRMLHEMMIGTFITAEG